jgi:hypothetical protein
MLPLSAATQRVVDLALHVSSLGELDKIQPKGSNRARSARSVARRLGCSWQTVENYPEV